jgi:hypothetical protein
VTRKAGGRVRQRPEDLPLDKRPDAAAHRGHPGRPSSPTSIASSRNTPAPEIINGR